MFRVNYTQEEDKEIVKYIRDNKAWLLVNGNRIWQNMERKKICKGRTFHSLRNRFLKTIQPDILKNFPSIVKEEDLPREYRKKLKYGLRQKIMQDGQPKVEKVIFEPLVTKSKENEEIVTESTEINGWTQPHCASPKKKRLHSDKNDYFEEDIFDEPAAVPMSQFTPEPITQIPLVIPGPSNVIPEIAESPEKTLNFMSRNKMWKKKQREKQIKDRKFFNWLSDKLLKMTEKEHLARLNQEKQKKFDEFLIKCLTNSPEMQKQIHENIVQIKDGVGDKSSLLENMLASLDESTRKEILKNHKS